MEMTSYLSGQLFVQAYRLLRTHVVVCLEQHGLTMNTWWLLGLVNNRPEGYQLHEAASELHVKAPHVTMMADKLIARGLLNRTAHKTDGRAKLLTITGKGSALLADVDMQISQELAYLLRGVPNDDLQAYRRVLDAIIRNGTLGKHTGS